MAELLTHFAVGHAGGKFLADERVRILFYLGNFLPDLVFKAVLYGMMADPWYCEPSHSPLMLVVIAFLLAHCFEERWRARAFLALYIGSIFHIAIDAMKDYLGMGVILWAFPFSMDRVELGWVRPNEGLYVTAGALILILLVEGGCRLARSDRH